MPRAIALRLLLKVTPKGLAEVCSGLVGQAEEYPQNISHLVGRILRFAGLKRLVAVAAGDDAGQFADFLGQTGHIGEFAKVANAVGLDPRIHKGLRLVKRRTFGRGG